MKTALIFGASRGIGAEIAKTFAKNGYFVVINYNHSETAAADVLATILRNGGKGVALKADISKYDEVENLIKNILTFRNTIDAVIVSSGIAKSNLLIDASIDEINNILNTNLLGTIYACKAVSPVLLEQHSGKIITISSMWGEVGACMESIYSASKGGIIAFTKALAKELGYNNINVNCIAPGLIDTEMNSNLTEETKKDLISNTPCSRIGQPSDIAKAALWLASDDASYLNGHILSVNGGFII